MKMPFWIYPAHWGLKGNNLELAKIDFYYTGIEADLKKADIMFLTEYTREEAKLEILRNAKELPDAEYELKTLKNRLNHNKISDKEYQTEVLNVKFKYHLITEKEKEYSQVELMEDGVDKDRASLDYVFKYHEITQDEYEKEIATLDGEPWFDFDIDYNEETRSVDLSFNYNEIFWKKLKDEGHPGSNEDEIIENFIRDWGRKLASDEYEGDYDAKLLRENAEMTGGISENLKVYK